MHLWPSDEDYSELAELMSTACLARGWRHGGVTNVQQGGVELGACLAYPEGSLLQPEMSCS